LSKFHFDGSEKGDEKISELVLNDDMTVQSSGSTTMTDQTVRMVCEIPPTTRSLVVDADLRVKERLGVAALMAVILLPRWFHR
jgi:hypothetical protein